MRFAHLADSHLGYAQYGLIERENDYYDVFTKTIDKIIESDVDFVIHSGDLFEKSRPTPKALLRFQDEFFRLKEANIPVYAIAGNHDTVLRKESVPPQLIFRKLGLNLLSKRNPFMVKNGVLICGVPFMPKTQKKALLKYYDVFSKKADQALKSILVSHQAIDKYLSFCEESYEVEIGEMPKNFDYYAMGHIHNYVNEPFGKGRLVYPGSMEIWKANEYENYLTHGKGFCIVDLSQDMPEVERVKIDLPRAFLKAYIDYNELESELRKIRSKIQECDEKPILELTVGNANFNTSDAYELISHYLKEDTLLFRPHYQQKNEIDVDVIKPGTINPKAMLKEILDNKYNDEKVSALAIDLLDNLSKNQIDEAEIISDNYYADNYVSKKVKKMYGVELDTEQSKLDNGSNLSESVLEQSEVVDGSDISESVLEQSEVDDNSNDFDNDDKGTNGTLDNYF